MTAMAMVHVRSEQTSHQRRDLPRVGQFDKQVEMIAHQTIMEQPEPNAVAVARHQLNECSTIPVIGEHRFAIVASVHEVKASFFRPLHVTRHACHEERLHRIRFRADLGAI
jgi:hypothetical protein